MSNLTPIGVVASSIVEAARKVAMIPKVYADLVAAQIRKSLLSGDIIHEAIGLQVDQIQQNGMWGIHQMRVTLPNNRGAYRVIVAPANAPIFVGNVSADEHFALPLVEKVVPIKAAAE